MGGLLFDNEPSEKKCNIKPQNDQCNNNYLINKSDIQFYGENEHVAFDSKAFCQFKAYESGNIPCVTTHYFFLGTDCKCGCRKPVYNKNEVYYLHNENGVYFLRNYMCKESNNKITLCNWRSYGKPGTWNNIYMICADPEHRGAP